MSVNKLVKYLNKPRPNREGLRSYTPVVLTDSKGNCLKSKAEHESEREIVWWEKSGDENKDRFNWLKDNLDHKLNLLGKVWRYVWLGTSDLGDIFVVSILNLVLGMVLCLCDLCVYCIY
jgi:hypothetical protein